MSQVAKPSEVIRRRVVVGWVAQVTVCAVLLAGCSTAARQSARRSRARPATTTVATTTTTAPPVTYQVQRGDTLTAIAKRFRVSVAAILAANHVADPDHLSEGQSLVIPPAPPLQLVVTPTDAQAGQAFELKLTGTKPAEAVTFEIDSPSGKFTGPPHTASGDGVVTATYQSSLGATTGTYSVIAIGNQGTTARASFRVEPATTAPTSVSG